MKRSFKILICGILACATLVIPIKSTAAVPQGPTVSSAAAVLMEKETGRVLYEQNAHEAMPPASVTKVMSLLIICEALNDGRLSLDDMVTCSDHAASMGGSQIYLEPGEQMSVRDMLKSVVLGSANDAIVALAEHVAGSEESFVAMMNTRSKELGMNDSTWKNACGLDVEGHVTSAYDIALMSRALLLEYPDIKQYTTIWMDSVRGGDFQLANTNKLVRSYTGITGLKTGYTSTAGHCLSASAERDGMELVCAILKGPSSAERFEAAKQLLDYGFANYALADLSAGGDALNPIPVKMGKAECVSVSPEGGSKMLVERAQLSSLEHEAVLPEEVEAPVTAGDTLGEVIVRAGGEELCRIPVVATENVERLGFGDIYSRLLERLFMGSKVEDPEG